MTDTISVLIGSGGTVHDVSSRVKYCTFTQRPATNGIGTWQLVLDNCDSALNGLFSGDDPIAIAMNNADFITGYLDKGPSKLKDVNWNYIYLSGRNSGQDTQNKILWSLYAHTDAFSGKADDIIQDMLTKTSSEIGFTSPSTAPEIYYSNNWGNLSEQFKEVLESVNYIGFTDKDLEFQMWDIATGRDSGITLKSLPDDASNNVLGEVEYEPGDTTDVQDFVIVEGPKTNVDAYTEKTASFFDTVYAGDVLSDFTGTSPLPPVAGAAAIKVTSNNGVDTGFKITFPKFWLFCLDFHLLASGDLKLNILAHFSGAISHAHWGTVFLKDDSGNEISWGGVDMTVPGGIDKWIESVIKIGYNENGNANWHTVSGSEADFTWKVTEIRIEYKYNSTIPGVLGYILVDGLSFPHAIVAASDHTLTSPVHTSRPYRVCRTDITSQVELQQYADQLGEKLVAPLSYLNLVAVGDAGLLGGVWMWLPGYYAKANIKDHNGNYLVPINSKWRFMELTHTFDPDNPKQGRVHWVEVKMVPYDSVIDNQRWTYANDNPDNPTSQIRRVRDRLRYIENTQSGNTEPQA